MKLHRYLGISCNASWCMRHKRMQVMMERDRQFPLAGWVELDDASLGGERRGASAVVAHRQRHRLWPPSRPTRRDTRCA